MGKRARVVIVGAGFGGLWAARALARSPVEVVLIDRNNYHTFQALLYQVAAAELEAEQVAYPVRGILRRLSNVRFVLAEVQGVDFDRREVLTAGPTIPYDFLILSMGSVTHFFGVPGAAECAFPLKTLEHGIDLRNHILRCFERATYTTDPEQRQQLLTIVVVGGGATGVELAGALAELIRGPLMRDYPMFDLREIRVVLLEAQEHLLPGMPKHLQAYALKRLGRMGVQVRLQAMVSRVAGEAVYLRDDTVVPSETTVWTAGVCGNTQAGRWGLPMSPRGRVTVLPTLQIPDHPEVYVVGDQAYVEEEGRPLPMVAPVAIQQGTTAARNVERQIAGIAPQPFHYRDPGSMATIGRNAAVVELGRWTFTGFAAWVLWLGVHLIRLIGFRNRLLVLINWAWDYFLFERAVRLILPSMMIRTSKAGCSPSDGEPAQRFSYPEKKYIKETN